MLKVLGHRSVSSFLIVLLNGMWYVVAAVLVIAVVLVIAGANVSLRIDFNGPSVETGPAAEMPPLGEDEVLLSIPVSFTLDRGTHPVRAPSLGIEHAQLERSRGTLRFPSPKGSFFAANLAIVVGMLVLFLWVLTQLRCLLRTVRSGHPFVPANAVRVRRVGWAIIAGELARSAIFFFEGAYAARHFSAAGLSFDARPDVDISAIISGLIILVIAEVFREGTRLDEDRSLTI